MAVRVHGAVGVNRIVNTFSAWAVPVLAREFGFPGNLVQMEVIIYSIEVCARCSVVLIEFEFIAAIIFGHLFFDALKNAFLRMIDLFLTLLLSSSEEAIIIVAVAIDVYLKTRLL